MSIFWGSNIIFLYLVSFSFAHRAVWTRRFTFACIWGKESWCFFFLKLFLNFFFSSYLSPSGGQSVPGNMPPSSVSGCCFASAVAYLLWKCWSGALTACGWAWAYWRQRWSRCASPADLCWGWREQRRSSRWTHPHHWPPGEPREIKRNRQNQRERVGERDFKRGSQRGRRNKKNKQKKNDKQAGQFRTRQIWFLLVIKKEVITSYEKSYINRVCRRGLYITATSSHSCWSNEGV